MMSILNIIGALGVFLYGMRLMSAGIQKVAGNRMQSIMNLLTKNRLRSIFTGFFTTALVQSSSATTVMAISFVNASLLTLVQAIGIIIGANIGTTVTTWIVSIVGFKFKITAIALPIIGVGLPFMFSKLKKRRDLGEILIGFGLLFLGLMFLKNSLPDIKSNPEVLSFLQNFTGKGFLSFIIFVGAGTLLTVMVQSSSAVLAITVTMAFMGWVDFQTSAAIVLGGNIGTTITAYLAALGTSLNARRAARAHILFNTIGVFWMAFVFTYFLDFILAIAPWKSHLQQNLPLNLSLFHTVFNLINTVLFLPFIRKFALLVEKLVKEKPSDHSKDYRLQYIATGIQSTAQVRLLTAGTEIVRMSELVRTMFNTFLEVFNNPDKKMGKKVREVEEQEILSDQMQVEIVRYLVECTKEGLSSDATNNVREMIRIINELENIGDSCFKLLLLAERKYDKQIQFEQSYYMEVNELAQIIGKFMGLYIDHMNERIDERTLSAAFQMENDIDNLRNKLSKRSQRRIAVEKDVKKEILYIDILRHLEHIGDHSLNISQSLARFL